MSPHPELAKDGDEPCSNVACRLRANHGGGCHNPDLDPPGDTPTYTRLRSVKP